MTTSPSIGREFVDDVVAVLAADQDAAVLALVADPHGRLAALQLRRWAVREIRQVAFSGVDDQHPRRAGGRDHLGQRWHHLLQQGDVVAEGLAESAGQQEVSLHVDDDQGGAADVERERSGDGIDGDAGDPAVDMS